MLQSIGVDGIEPAE